MPRSGPRRGFELPLLLGAGFRSTIDELHRRLADRGHPDLRPTHGFALQAIGADGVTVSALARRLGVTKQGAAKTVTQLAELGYISRGNDPDDARASSITLTERGRDCLRVSAEIFDELHRDWARLIGAERLSDLTEALTRLFGSEAGHGGQRDRLARLTDLPGWLR